MSYSVFISYASSDSAVAEAVCSRLEDGGINCWIAPRDVLPGIPYGESLVTAIEECPIFLIIFSSSSNNSPQVSREVERAVSKGKILVPFRIENIMPTKAMEYALSNIHWLDALTPPMDRHIEKLYTTIRKLIEIKSKEFTVSNHSGRQADSIDALASQGPKLSIEHPGVQKPVSPGSEDPATDSMPNINLLSSQIHSALNKTHIYQEDLKIIYEHGKGLNVPDQSITDLIWNALLKHQFELWNGTLNSDNKKTSIFSGTWVKKGYSAIQDKAAVSAEIFNPVIIPDLVQSQIPDTLEPRKSITPKKQLYYFSSVAVLIMIIIIGIFIFSGDDSNNTSLTNEDNQSSSVNIQTSDTMAVAKVKKHQSSPETNQLKTGIESTVEFSKLAASFNDNIKRGLLSNAQKDLVAMKNLGEANRTVAENSRILAMLKNMVYVSPLMIYIDKHETTNGEYSSFVKEYNNTGKGPKLSIPPLNKDDLSSDRPVHYISFLEAQRFASFYNKRLPTIDEWLAALDVENSSPFLYGLMNPYDTGNLWGVQGKDIWEKNTSPAGSFKPNRYGIYDMIGNVAEWCSDGKGSAAAYVVGGNINSKAESLKRETVKADSRFPSIKYFHVGFRCVYDPRNK